MTILRPIIPNYHIINKKILLLTNNIGGKWQSEKNHQQPDDQGLKRKRQLWLLHNWFSFFRFADSSCLISMMRVNVKNVRACKDLIDIWAPLKEKPPVTNPPPLSIIAAKRVHSFGGRGDDTNCAHYSVNSYILILWALFKK